MFNYHCVGTVMPSEDSEVVKNSPFLSKLRLELIRLSEVYGLGEVLFMEKNPTNPDGFNSFYIRAPKDMPFEERSRIWDEIGAAADDFARKEGVDSLIRICNVAVSSRY